MNLLKYKGKHIRVSDKSLVFRFSAGSLFLLFLAVIMLLNLKSILTTDWKSVSFLQDGNVHLVVTPYRIVTIVVAALVCVLAALFYRRFQYDRVKQSFTVKSWLVCCWKMAGMNQNPHRTAAFSRICQPLPKKRKSPIFLKCITVWSMDLYISVQKSHWGNIKSSFYTWKRNWKQACTVSGLPKELKDSYVEYVLLYDTIANRITINEVQAEHGSLRLMKNVWWEYDELPIC